MKKEGGGERKDVPPDKVLGIGAQLLVRREMQMPRPVDDLPIRIMRLLCAERRPSNQALKHDGPQTPPITPKVVALAGKDLRRNVIRCTDSRVRKLATRLAPRVDLLAVRDGELDLVEVDGLAVVAVGSVFAACEELLVV